MTRFKSVWPDTPSAAVHFGGVSVPVRPGEMLAAALLRSDILAFGRTDCLGNLRGPFCLMGSCYQCLVVIDDGPPARACRTPARDGMRVRPAEGTIGGAE